MPTQLNQQFVEELDSALQNPDVEAFWSFREKWQLRLNQLSDSDLSYYKSETVAMLSQKSTRFEQAHKKFRRRLLEESSHRNWDLCDIRGIETDFFGPCNSTLRDLKASFAVIDDLNLYGCSLTECDFSHTSVGAGSSIRQVIANECRFRHTHFGDSSEFVRTSFHYCDFESATIGEHVYIANVELFLCKNIPDWLAESPGVKIRP